MQEISLPAEDVGKSHLVIGIPTCRMTTVRWGINLAICEYPLSMSYNFMTVRGEEAGEARNKIVKMAKDVKAKLLLMIDDDVHPPQHAVQKLLHSMLNKPNVMASAGIVYTKSKFPQPLVFPTDGSGACQNWKKGEVFEVPGFISTGCMLIKMEVFDKIPYPWFQTVEYPAKMTEDVYFCLKVKKAGYKILAHGGVLCGHWDFNNNKMVTAPKDPELVGV